jgi:hypothetical protein
MAKTTPTKDKEIYRYPGKEQLQYFLTKHSKLFNFSEIERMCSFPGGTMRHICAGTRSMDNSQYKKVQEIVLPKLCEFVFLLQNYSATKEVTSRY